MASEHEGGNQASSITLQRAPGSHLNNTKHSGADLNCFGVSNSTSLVTQSVHRSVGCPGKVRNPAVRQTATCDCKHPSRMQRCAISCPDAHGQPSTDAVLPRQRLVDNFAARALSSNSIRLPAPRLLSAYLRFVTLLASVHARQSRHVSAPKGTQRSKLAAGAFNPYAAEGPHKGAMQSCSVCKSCLCRHATCSDTISLTMHDFVMPNPAAHC